MKQIITQLSKEEKSLIKILNRTCHIDIFYNFGKEVHFITFEYFSNEYEIEYNKTENHYNFNMITEYEEFRGKLEAKSTTLKYDCSFKVIKNLIKALVAEEK